MGVKDIAAKIEQGDLNDHQTQLEIARLKHMTALMEGIPTFAQDDDEGQWTALTKDKAMYTEQELTDMRTQASDMYYTDPGARCVINTMVNFIIGKDAGIIPEDPNDEVHAYWTKFTEVNGWDLRFKELVRRAMRDGESFLRFFKPGNALATDLSADPGANELADNAVPKVRFIVPNEIVDKTQTHSYGIETDSDDIETVLNYIRTYQDAQAVEQTEVIPAAQIIHTKILADSDMKRGTSFLVGIAKYLTKYRGWLEDRIMLNKIRTLFNLIMRVSGDPTAVKAKFEDTQTSQTQSGQTKKKLPERGTVLVGTTGVDYEFANLNINAEDTKGDGRNIELMVCKGTGLTEYVVRGDASNANYSSTMVSESPMVRTFEAWQDIFAQVAQAVFKTVMQIGMETGYVPKTTKQPVPVYNPDTMETTTKVVEKATCLKCTVHFSQLIHRDPKEEGEAAEIHYNLKLASTQTLSENVGYDYTKEKPLIEREGKERDDIIAKNKGKADEEQKQKQKQSSNDDSSGDGSDGSDD